MDRRAGPGDPGDGPRRDRVQTVINAGTGLGVAAAGPVALLVHGHWRAAWFVFAACSALVTVWCAAAVPAGPARRSPGPGGGPVVLPRPLLPAGSARLVTAAGLMGAASAAVWTFGRDVLVAGGMGDRDSTVAWILLGALGVLGASAGDVAGRLGIQTAWPVAMATLAAVTLLLAAFPADTAAAWVLAAVSGATYIGLTGLLLVWGVEVYARSPVAGVGLAFLVIALGQAAGAPVVGAIGQAVGFRPAFAVAALIAVAGGLVRPRRQGRRTDPPSVRRLTRW